MKYVIEHRIKELINTIAEAMEYILKLTEELKYENIDYLIEDIQDAVESIESAVIENYINAEIEDETQRFQKELKELKKKINSVEISEDEINISMTELKSSYTEWKTRIYKEITPRNINWKRDKHGNSKSNNIYW